MQKEEFTVRVRGLERRMYRIARTMLTCDQDMEDAVQNAILKAWEKRASLRENAFFETWLIRIMINVECVIYDADQKVFVPEGFAVKEGDDFMRLEIDGFQEAIKIARDDGEIEINLLETLENGKAAYYTLTGKEMINEKELLSVIGID